MTGVTQHRACNVLAAVCIAAVATSTIAGPRAETVPTPLMIASLPNAFRLHADVLSGGQPAGKAGFSALKRLGVRTVLSVDGAKPDVTAANELGLRYVHLPHGYDGISQSRRLELAKAVRELPRPIYIHCHHGKHRAPVAAAVACIGAGLIPVEKGQAFLELAGTSRDYQGLYRVISTAMRYDPRRLNAITASFPKTAKVPPLATAMVQVERTFDNLNRIAKSGWRTPPRHPDLSPPHEALMLREHLTELLRTDDVRNRPDGFRQILAASERDAKRLRNQLRTSDVTKDGARRSMSRTLAEISSKCQQCHRQYRD